MRISTIVPVYNGERFLEEALESIVSQDYPDHEVIVVDDGSTDASKDIARGFGVTVISTPHSGVAAARNQGLAAASGRMLAFLDADDRWEANKLSTQLAFLSENPDVDGVFGFMRNYLHEGVAQPSWLADRQLERDIPGHSLCTLLVRREVFDLVGTFDPKIESGEDGDWFFRAKDMGIQFRSIEKRFLLRRIHDRNLSHDATAVRAGILRAVRASLGRGQRDGDNDA